MRLYDQHLHSWNSFDSRTPPADNVESAIAAGLAGLTFTEHFDTHPTEWPECIYDDAKIESELAGLRRTYGDRIFIGKGIEVCYQPSRMDFILDFLARHRFDVVLLSVHWAFDKPVHVREHFADMTAEQYIRHHLEAVREATAGLVRMKHDGHQPFHILAHLDFAKRYAKSFYGYDGRVEAPDLIDEIVRNCLAAGIIPEINTSTLRNSMAAPMPGIEIIERYAALGGTMMSLGSDAHRAACIGSHFDVALDLLRRAGIGQVALFEDGRVRGERITSTP